MGCGIQQFECWYLSGGSDVLKQINLLFFLRPLAFLDGFTGRLYSGRSAQFLRVDVLLYLDLARQLRSCFCSFSLIRPTW